MAQNKQLLGPPESKELFFYEWKHISLIVREIRVCIDDANMQTALFDMEIFYSILAGCQDHTDILFQTDIFVFCIRQIRQLCIIEETKEQNCDIYCPYFN